MTLVDTSVWSLALRRRSSALSSTDARFVASWRELVSRQHAAVIGIIRQEVVGGIKDATVFDRLRLRLNDMPCLNAGIDEHDLAAQFFNRCSARGIAARAVDMLICAVSVTADVAILAADKDFSRYARMLPITLVA